MRRAGPEHWETYRDLRITSLIDSPRAFWTTYATAARWSEEEWRDRLGWPTLFAYAPLSPDPDQPPAPVGLVSLWRAPETPEGDIVLIQMWVASWVRGRGVTDLLMQTAVEAAREDGWDRVVLKVVEGNDRAMGAYRRLGFVRTGRTARMPWDESVTEVEMVLELAPETLDPPPGDAGGDEDCGG